MRAIVDFLTQTRDTFQAALDDSRFQATLAEIADLVTASLRGDGKLLTIGNGGSAADAQHIAGEFVSRLNYDRPPAAAVALMPNRELAEAVNAEMAAHPDGSAYATLLIDEYERRDPSELLALGMQG